MIEAKELRIGNLITDRTHEILNVNAIYINCCQVQGRVSYHYLEDIKGIPLTPEILKKLGFVEKRKNAWYKGRLQWNGHLVYLKNEDTEECYYIPTIVDYLHQLQNLYFALKGEELEIKL